MATIDWNQFHDWLVSQGKAKRTVKTNVQYAKRFASVLDTGDASSLPTKLAGKRRAKEIALVALANYAKFVGKYERFLELKKRYALKWSTSNSTQYFERFFNEELTLDVMIERICQMVRVLPADMSAVVKFACLVGLRASECIESVKLLTRKNSEIGKISYYNPERQALEHFRFPDIFLRQTKKAYISFLSTDNYERIATLGPKTPTLNAITLACRRKGVKMEMHLCRKVFASWLRKEGVQPEVVDLLQGRCPQNVLVRHYLTPSSDYKQQVLAALEKLQSQLQ